MPKMSSEKPKDIKVTFGKFVRSLKPHRWSLLIVTILTIIATVLSIFGPKVLGSMTTTAVTDLTTNGAINWEPITKSAILLLVLYIISAILNYITSVIIGIVTARYTQNLRAEIVNKISRLPISYFDQHQYGDVISRMTNDIDTIANSLAGELTDIVTSVTMVIGILIMMASISWVLSIIAIVAIPLSLFFVSFSAKKAQKYFHGQQAMLGQLNNHIEEDYSGQLIIKSNSCSDRIAATFQKSNQSLYEQSWKAQFYSSIAFPIAHVFTNLSYVAICISGGYFAINGKIAIGDIQAFIQYVNQFNRPITEVAQITSTIQLTLAASERIFNFLDEAEQMPDVEPALSLKKIRGEVEFHDVCFSYTDKPTIQHFSVKIKPGQQVAIVGPTGAGKTTIINLLMRFYDPNTGYITIDGTPTREMKRENVRSLFGMVLQDTWLFSGTILDNLRYGNSKATDADIHRIAESIGISHFIESLPNGYNSVISEDSDNISAGEKQLITIARALIANPPMMILDEATSNVDTRTEQLIQNAFDKLTQNRTSFVIAHRLSTIRNSDLILVMRDGQIIEHGSHDELLASNGFYSELYNSQFAK